MICSKINFLIYLYSDKHDTHSIRKTYLYLYFLKNLNKKKSYFQVDGYFKNFKNFLCSKYFL